MTLDQLLQLLGDGGWFVGLLAVLWAGHKKVWRWGYQFEEMVAYYVRQLEETKKERDEWRTLAMRGTIMADKAVTLATPLITATKPDTM